MFLKVKIILTVIILILNSSYIVKTWHTTADFDYFNHGYEGPSSYYYSKQLIDHNEEPCRCIKLKYCNTLREIVKQAKFPLSDEFLTNLRKTSCGYEDNEPLVCCPPTSSILDLRSRRSSFHGHQSTEKPWVWDVEENSHSGENQHVHSQNCNHFFDNYNSYPNLYNFNYGGDKLIPNLPAAGSLLPNNFPNLIPNNNLNKKFFKFREFYPHFEDQKTRKNCPPSFSREFELPETVVGVTPAVPTIEPTMINPAVPIIPITPTITVPSEPEATASSDIAVQISVAKRSLVNAPICGLSVNTRIIGGEDAGPGQFPWMARLAYRNKTSSRVTYRCAGSVISEKYILTAAHCVTNLIDDLEVVMVRLGELDARTDKDCTADQTRCTESQDFEIEKIIPHNMYDAPKYANDIALIKLIRSTNSSEFISPLCLPIDAYSNSGENLTGKMGIISGWGSMTAGSNAPSPIMQWVRLPIVDTVQCATAYARFSANSRTPIIVSSAQMCVQGRENMDACQGDSGGPLMSDGTEGNERYTLLGLVSFGPRTCGVSNFPGVYTRITSYMSWIMDNMDM